MVVERMGSHRQEKRQAGWIIDKDGQKKPCVVSDLSRYGAKITLLGNHELPAEFILSFSHENRRSRAVWRTCFNVGVRFDEAA